MTKRHIIILVGLMSCLAMGAALPVQAQQQTKKSAAATRSVSGTVVDEEGEPIIGATVAVAGQSKTGAITDLNGKFTLQVPQGGKLKVSYIGYVSQTVSKLDGALRIVLKEDNNSLDDVVVVGYGALKQKNVTGAVEVINPEDMKDLAVTSLSEALIGLSPSLHVSMPSTGRPGENATITIRQARDAVALIPTTDMNGEKTGGVQNPSPLYVIDDFIYQDSEKGEDEFNNLDVDEVESITILKDAAAAVYGAYGAYGVILVKTKRGKAGTPRISYQLQTSYVDAMMHAEMLNGYEYGTVYNAAKAANVLQSGKTPDRLLHFFQADELEQMKDMNYNLLDKYWSSSLNQRHSVNVNGGTEKVTYFAGVTYQTQDGNIGKLDYNRWNYRAGLTANVTKFLRATLSIAGDDTEKNMHQTSSSGAGNQEDYVYMLKNPSYIPDEINGYPIYHSGMENSPSFTNYYNYKSLYNSLNNRQQVSSSMSIQGTLDADLGQLLKPLKGLHVKLTYSRNVGNSEQNQIKMENTVYRVKNRGGSGQHLYITDPNAIIGGPDAVYDETTLQGFRYTAFENLEERVLNSGKDSYLRRDMDRSKSYQVNLMLMYGRKFGKHDVSGTFSIEKGESETENVWGSATHPLPFTDGQSSSLADDTEKETEWNRTEGGNLAYIGRLNYAFADRYLFEFLVRAQASTKFSPENYWGAFPSFSAGWVLSEEKWFPKDKLKIDFLKLRASYGIMGRDNVEAWRWLERYAYNPNRSVTFGTDISQESTRAFQLPEKSGTNPDLHWDKNVKTNIGLDLRMLDSRLSVVLDAYYDFGREIFSIPTANEMPGTAGTYPAPENYSEMDMYGIDAIVGWRQRINKDMYVSARLGIAYSDNKVLKNYWPRTGQRKFDSLVKGERSDRGLWGYSCLGMFRSYQEIEEYFEKYHITSYLGLSQSQVHPGMLIYEDIRGKKIEGTDDYGEKDGVIGDEDMVQISKRKNNPYTSNLNLNFVYKSLALNATFTAEWGAYTMMPGMYEESFSSMETTNVSKMWADMFVYEDVLDAQGNVIAFANRDGRWPNFGYTEKSVNSQRSTFWRMSATEIYLRNITLAYTLPKKWVSYVGLHAARINITCQNAFSLYNACPGHYWNNFAGNYGSYPVTRKITAGVNLTF